MERKTFALKAFPGMRDQAAEKLHALKSEILEMTGKLDIQNFSIWGVEDLLYGYGEFPPGLNETEACHDMQVELAQQLSDCVEIICELGTMRLMYQDYGIVREDKSLIRHRVFSTKLKPACEEEYKRRHDVLVEARGDKISEGPDSNFSVWYGAGYIFGYCEKVKSFDQPMTDEERQSTIEWETRQLEIMDWLTDDVDWMTGDKHESIRRIV